MLLQFHPDKFVLAMTEISEITNAAIEAPRIHAYKKTLHVEGRIPPQIIRQLEKLGHNMKVHPDFDNYFGGAQGILINPQEHNLHGGANLRRDGVVLGY